MRNRSEYAWSESGRMYWNLRNRLGQFVNRAGFNRSQREQQHAAWRAYLDARRDAAERDTRGHMVIDWRASVARLFMPGASLRNASEELRDWFTAHGPTLSFRDFCAQY